jgi:Response regulator receiver domain
MTIQVILADDQPLIRAGLRRMIDQTPDIDVAGEAGSGAEAVQLTREASPDVVVMDIRMPGMDGSIASAPQNGVVRPEPRAWLHSGLGSQRNRLIATKPPASPQIARTSSWWPANPRSSANGFNSAWLNGRTGKTPARSLRNREVIWK